MDVTTCDSYTSPSGAVYTNSGSFTDIIPNAAGCDSLISINLTINNSTASTDVITACESYTWINGVTYTSNNSTATYVLTNSTGCDSIVTLNLTIQTINNSTTLSGETITASQVGASYQWIDCDNNFAIIPGETNQSFTATSNGNYAVIVTNANGCSDTSACVEINTLAIDENALISGIMIAPNPTSGVLSVSSNDFSGAVSIEVRDLAGNLVMKTHEELAPSVNTTIDLSEAAAGVYMIYIKGQNQSLPLRVVKK
jgi:hypothetical protein